MDTDRQLLLHLYPEISGITLPGPAPSAFGDSGVGDAAQTATAIWLAKNVGLLIGEVAAKVGSSLPAGASPADLVNRLVQVLDIETRHLPNKTRLELLARLMINLGAGASPAGADWSDKLRRLVEREADSIHDSTQRKLLKWAVAIELDCPDLSLSQREDSFRREFRVPTRLPDAPPGSKQHRLNLLLDMMYGRFNSWACVLLHLGLYRSASPIAAAAFRATQDAAAMDTYGWALFFEGDHARAEELLSQAICSFAEGGSTWCEVQYHRAHVAAWSGRQADAKSRIAKLNAVAPDNYWAKKATELKPLLAPAKRKVARKPSSSSYAYDVALSFAGEDRACAGRLASLLSDRGVAVFYDEYERAALWGQDLYRYLSEIYMKQARFCVIFVSRRYMAKPWTDLECRAAQARAFQEKSPYILPIRLDETEIPGLPPTVGYLSWEQDGAEVIADVLVEKLAGH